MIYLIIPRVPIAQPRPRVTFKHGKVWAYEPIKITKEKQAIGTIAKQYMIENNLKPIDKPFRMNINCYLPIPKSWSKSKIKAAINRLIYPTGCRNDWDNLGKLISDALNKICYTDDSLCCRAYITKDYSDESRTYVFIEEIKEHLYE